MISLFWNQEKKRVIKILISNKPSLAYILKAEYININTKRAWFIFTWEYDLAFKYLICYHMNTKLKTILIVKIFFEMTQWIIIVAVIY